MNKNTSFFLCALRVCETLCDTLCNHRLSSHPAAGAIWYVAAPLLARSLDDGFDWIAFLHAQGAEVDAWTLDADRPGHVSLAQRLVAAG